MSKHPLIAHCKVAFLAIAAAWLWVAPAIGQAPRQALPNAPSARPASAQLQVALQQTPLSPATLQHTGPPMPPLPGPALPAGPELTIAQAEQMAIQHNPNISVARLLALAQGQVTREVRSAEMPQAYGDLDAADAHANSRFTGGDVSRTLTGSRLFEKAAAGMTVKQLITDFGRTHNLVLSAQSSANAQLENQRATELDIILAVDEAFYQTLTAQAVLKVAQQTVTQRQATVDQVNALTAQKLRSDLDLSFADVQLSQAQLLLLDAQNDMQTSMAALNNVLGSDQNQQYSLVDSTSANPAPPPQNAEVMVQAAFGARPDLAALNDEYKSAQQFSRAERDLWMPTVSAEAAGGGTPVRGGDGDVIQSSYYLGAGANVNIPVFNGFLFNADSKEAKLRAQAAQENVRNLRDIIARDVRTSVLQAQAAFQRIGVTQEMLNQSNMALDLAQARYKIGLSGIVELTQAQLAQMQAEIAYSSARFAYQTAMAEVRYQIGQ